jgi:hypothetical protein
MGMTRGVALVLTRARVVQLTGQQSLANLEASAELSLPDLLVSSSDAIYDRLEVDGISPTALSNETRFERAVAYLFLAQLAALGVLQGAAGETSQQTHDKLLAMSDRFYEQVRPRLGSGDEPPRPGEGVLALGNFDTSGGYYTDFPQAS